ncbi:MAG: RluA family pseudouridine synthase [Acidobacteriota bacterium]|nr:RluA family pseudouridine synthase [Acidobacteriota bacterium]
MRLDQAIAARHPEISRRKARELIAQKRVLVNDRPVAVASREVSERDRITLTDALPELTIIRETREWIAVDKPAGMPAQPTRDRVTRSLEEWLRIRYRDIYLVHRIDTQTTGVLVFARTRTAAAELSLLFASREITKTYIAFAEGRIDRELIIESPIGGKDAHTIVRPVKEVDGMTMVEAEIKTGRTHQIRIHLKSIERPVAGDRRYGSTMPSPRMLLHAWKLAHPFFGDDLIAPLPPDMLHAAG